MGLKRIMEDQTLILLADGAQVLKLQEKVDDQMVTIELEGVLRSDTAQDLEDELAAFTLLGMNIILSMSGVTYLSSSCMQVLIGIQQKMDRLKKGTLRLINVPQTVMSNVKRTGASELLDIEE